MREQSEDVYITVFNCSTRVREELYVIGTSLGVKEGV